MCAYLHARVGVREHAWAHRGARVRTRRAACVAGCVCTGVRSFVRTLCVHTLVRARGSVFQPVYPYGCARRGVHVSVCAGVHAGGCACVRTCVLVLHSVGACVSACAEELGCGHVSVCWCMSVRRGGQPRACVQCLSQAAGADNCGCYCEPVNPPNPFTSCSQGITN